MLIVGYGKKDGKDVWVVRNNYGEHWNGDGYFMVEIGANAFCLETYAFAAIPAILNLTSLSLFSEWRDMSNRGNTSYLDKECEGVFENGNCV